MANLETNNIVDQTNDLNTQEQINQAAENPSSETIDASSKDAKKGGSTLKSSLVGGATGIALGAVSSLLTGATVLPINPDDPQNDADHHNDVKITFATSVNDDMTYNEAFSAARQEVGPGGAFVWHGTVYGTYYGSEWNALTPEQQAEFSQNAIAQQPVVENNHSANNHHTSNHQQHTDTQHQQQHHEEHHEAAHDQHTEVVEVEVDGVVENVELEDGSVVNLGFATIDGHDATFVDVDHDGSFDLVAVDANDDGTITNNEVSELSQNSGMNVDSFYAELGQTAPEPTGDILADTGYTNDDDPSAFA